MSAGLRLPAAPAGASIELRDEREKAVRGRIQVAGELSDLIPKLANGNERGACSVHGHLRGFEMRRGVFYSDRVMLKAART